VSSLLSNQQVWELRDAIQSVESEFDVVVPFETACLIIEWIYEKRNGETGDDFRHLFEKAVERFKVSPCAGRKFVMTCARYFQPRALDAIANAKQCAKLSPRRENLGPAEVVGKPTAWEVRLLSGMGETVTFRATVKDGRLAWNQVKDQGVHPALLPSEVAALHKQALSMMNAHRKRIVSTGTA